MGQKLLLQIPKNFSFKQTVRSHGWSALLPFEWEPERLSLGRVFHTDGAGEVVFISLSHDKENIQINGLPTADCRLSTDFLSFAFLLQFLYFFHGGNGKNGSTA